MAPISLILFVSPPGSLKLLFERTRKALRPHRRTSRGHETSPWSPAIWKRVFSSALSSVPSPWMNFPPDSRRSSLWRERNRKLRSPRSATLRAVHPLRLLPL